MSGKEKFLKFWLLLGAAAYVITLIIIAFTCLVAYSSMVKINLPFLISLVIIMPFIAVIIVVIIRWSNRLEVPAEWNFIFEWNGVVLPPLTPGLYYPFPYFKFLSDGTEVPMNKQMLHILSGVREGLPTEVVEKYVYGSSTNVEPNTGDFLRLMYMAEIKCVNPVKLVYEKADPYGYIVGLLEREVVIFIKKPRVANETVNDKFIKNNWYETFFIAKLIVTQTVNASVYDTILAETGIELIKFIPIDVINTPETEESRRDVEMEMRKGEVLKKLLINTTIKKKISAVNDSMRDNSVKTILTNAGVTGEVALNYLNEQKKLDTIQVVGTKGNITYMDNSGKGKLTNARVMGWGLTANNIQNNNQNNNQTPPIKPNPSNSKIIKKPKTT